ncbi:hypothetical protein ACLKA6_011346 [Drosophila palustris]
MDSQETYAVLGNCLSIGNTTVCQEKNLKKLDEGSCIPRLLKEGHGFCDNLRNDQTSPLRRASCTFQSPSMSVLQTVQFDRHTLLLFGRVAVAMHSEQRGGIASIEYSKFVLGPPIPAGAVS